MEKVTYIWKIKLSRPWTFGNDSDSVQFLTSTDVRIQKYSSMFGFPWKSIGGFPWKSIGEFSMVYKKMSADMA